VPCVQGHLKFDNIIIAHRGGRPLLPENITDDSDFPENTISAYKWASKCKGAEAIELDTWLSKDHIPMVVHDSYLASTLMNCQELSKTFPLLVKVVEQILAIPATSASVERAFSDAGLTITELRTNINPDTLNDCEHWNKHVPVDLEKQHRIPILRSEQKVLDPSVADEDKDNDEADKEDFQPEQELSAAIEIYTTTVVKTNLEIRISGEKLSTFTHGEND
ncbi:unnamed protein product, partial [Didymodactylos carnosus]